MTPVNPFNIPVIDDNRSREFLKDICDQYADQHHIDHKLYEKYNVKRGLRNADGTGVMAGITRIGSVRGYVMQDGDIVLFRFNV